MGRPPLEKKQRQLAVALPDDVRERLEAAVEKSGRSLAEEIRRRLNESFEADAHDDLTRDFAYAGIWMAEELGRQADAPWHSSRKGCEALVVAIKLFLEGVAPGKNASDPLAADDAPTLGRSVARHFQRHIFEMRKVVQILRGDRKP
jgi:Arc-like DNA binding domain